MAVISKLRQKHLASIFENNLIRVEYLYLVFKSSFVQSLITNIPEAEGM